MSSVRAASAVLVAQIGARPQRVAKTEVVAQSERTNDGHVDVLSRSAYRRPKGEAIRHTHLTERLVAGRCDRSDGGTNDVAGDHDIDVDHRLRRQVGHRRAADVFDGHHRQGTECVAQRRGDLLEPMWPLRVVGNDHELPCHAPTAAAEHFIGGAR